MQRTGQLLVRAENSEQLEGSTPRHHCTSWWKVETRVAARESDQSRWSLEMSRGAEGVDQDEISGREEGDGGKQKRTKLGKMVGGQVFITIVSISSGAG